MITIEKKITETEERYIRLAHNVKEYIRQSDELRSIDEKVEEAEKECNDLKNRIFEIIAESPQ